MNLLQRLFPPGDPAYQGPLVPFYFFVVITVIGSIRSLIHMLAADGGAHVIAGLVIDRPAGQNVVAIFGQWGASQLLIAIVSWLVILRYRALVPMMLLITAVEHLLRILVGQLKPILAAGPPPGAIGSEILLPITLGMLVWSLQRRGE